MHSIYQRVSNLSAFLSSCVFALLGLVALSTFVLPANPTGSLSVVVDQIKPSVLRRYAGVKKSYEFALVHFNATADLTPLFNWNTKQVFVYFSAEYTNAQGMANDVVIWDRIISRKEDAFINVYGKNKYQFKDVSTSFKDIPEAHYTLKYNVMPYVGVLTYGEAARTIAPVPFPPVDERVA